ncbi:MAG: DUF1287 domain-containing protein [Syntrophomonadaceae bacterium]
MKNKAVKFAILGIILTALVVFLWYGTNHRDWLDRTPLAPGENLSPVERIPPDQRKVPDLIVLGARQEVSRGTVYDASYQQLAYPGGDVPLGRGACTDVVIRAIRNAGLDLQVLVHEDMKQNFSAYPQLWGLKKPDSNIDHRRVPNLVCFFTRHGQTLSKQVDGNLDEWQWGDVVIWRFPNGLLHCGVISDRKNGAGMPLVIHNCDVAREQDILTYWEIIGHYRYP